jgi:hypothetical protein
MDAGLCYEDVHPDAFESEEKQDGVVHLAHEPAQFQHQIKSKSGLSKPQSTKERMRILSLKLQKLNRGVDVSVRGSAIGRCFFADIQYELVFNSAHQLHAHLVLLL